MDIGRCPFERGWSDHEVDSGGDHWTAKRKLLIQQASQLMIDSLLARVDDHDVLVVTILTNVPRSPERVLRITSGIGFANGQIKVIRKVDAVVCISCHRHAIERDIFRSCGTHAMAAWAVGKGAAFN